MIRRGTLVFVLDEVMQALEVGVNIGVKSGRQHVTSEAPASVTGLMRGLWPTSNSYE